MNTRKHVACVAGVKRGSGNLGARGRKESNLLPPPSRAVSRPNSLPRLPLPFRTPATQASKRASLIVIVTCAETMVVDKKFPQNPVGK